MRRFKEHLSTRPYGDVGFKIRELPTTTHPYRWQTIGKELSHIENVQIDDVKNFFYKHYRPVNAILVVAATYKPTACWSSPRMVWQHRKR